MPTHVVIDAHLAVKEIDGVSRYLNGLLTELPKIDSTIQYTILALPANKSSLPMEIFSHANVKRFDLDLRGPTPLQHWIIPRVLKALEADVYHHPQYDLPPGAGPPSVVTIHDLKYILHPEFLKKKKRLKSWYIKKSLQSSLKTAQHIIAVSKNTLEDLKQTFSFEDQKATVIYHGFGSRAEHNTEPGSNPFHLPNNFVLFVGSRRPHKNIEGLIQALNIIREKNNISLDLVVAGKAYADYREPEKLTTKLGMDGHVHFLDFVPDEKLPWLYKRATLVALVSFYEGFGLPLLEAMSYGKPVIGSNSSSIPEVVGEAGLLVDPHDHNDIADKIYKIVTAPELCKKLSTAGLARFKQFSWRRVAESTLDVYIKALNK